jgi:hypothetical protein
MMIKGLGILLKQKEDQHAVYNRSLCLLFLVLSYYFIGSRLTISNMRKSGPISLTVCYIGYS